MIGPFAAEPSHIVRSADGTPIAVFALGQGPPVVLVHGTTADHLTWRMSGPLLARRRAIHAVDRRGRGASGDGPAYAIEREFEDVAAVAEAIASGHGAAVPVVGHSLGGRIALGAALRTPAIERVVAYESAPEPPGATYEPEGLVGRLREHLGRGDPAAALATFMTEVVGMGPDDLARFRADPVWPLRVAAAHTILRELEGAGAREASLEALGAVEVPVLQVLGSASAPVFGSAVRALDARLADGRIVTVEGARHGAHHTHAETFVAAVDAFLDG